MTTTHALLLASVLTLAAPAPEIPPTSTLPPEDPCRLEAINVNLNRQPGMGAGDGYMVSGNITMTVTLK